MEFNIYDIMFLIKPFIWPVAIIIIVMRVFKHGKEDEE
jgi:hypothetical protein